MTVAQAIALLAKMPPDAPLCFCMDETFVEITQIELAPATSEDDHFVVTFDVAAADAIRVAVVV